MQNLIVDKDSRTIVLSWPLTTLFIIIYTKCIERERLQTGIYGNSNWSLGCHGNTKGSEIARLDLLISTQTSPTWSRGVVTLAILIKKWLMFTIRAWLETNHCSTHSPVEGMAHSHLLQGCTCYPWSTDRLVQILPRHSRNCHIPSCNPLMLAHSSSPYFCAVRGNRQTYIHVHVWQTKFSWTGQLWKLPILSWLKNPDQVGG